MHNLTTLPQPASAIFHSLFQNVKAVNPYLSDEDILIGIYLFCEENVSGQFCPLYAILSQIDFCYRGKDVEADFPEATEARDILRDIK